MPLLQTASGSIWYADHRRQDGKIPPVVLVHGAGGTHLDWPGELRRLPGVSVIAPDLPGHGRSPGPGRQTTETYAADILALLDALSLENAILIGHSLGSAVALTAALHHPDRVAGLVLIGASAKLGVHPDILNNLLGDKAQAVSLIASGYWSPAASDEARQQSYTRLMAVDSTVLHGDYLACNTFDLRPRLGEIHQPTLIIGGSADQLTPFKASEYLRDHLANAQLVRVAGGGHMLMLEQPAFVAAAVTKWLAVQSW